MILPATTISTRFVAALGSAALHAGVAVAVVAGGHSAKAGAPAAPLAAIEMVAPEIESPIPIPEAVAEQDEHAHASHTHTHTHSYPVPKDHDDTPHDPSLVHVPLARHAAADAPAAAPEVVTAPASVTPTPVTPTFVMPTLVMPTLVMNAGHAVPPGGVSAAHGVDAPSEGDAPLPETGVDSPARLLGGESAPPYPPQAREQSIEADVPVEIVVDASGRVIRAHAMKHVGYGLDEAAERAVRGYRFSPAQVHGHATAVRVRWPVQFRLR